MHSFTFESQGNNEECSENLVAKSVSLCDISVLISSRQLIMAILRMDQIPAARVWHLAVSVRAIYEPRLWRVFWLDIYRTLLLNAMLLCKAFVHFQDNQSIRTIGYVLTLWFVFYFLFISKWFGCALFSDSGRFQLVSIQDHHHSNGWRTMKMMCCRGKRAMTMERQFDMGLISIFQNLNIYQQSIERWYVYFGESYPLCVCTVHIIDRFSICVVWNVCDSVNPQSLQSIPTVYRSMANGVCNSITTLPAAIWRWECFEGSSTAVWHYAFSVSSIYAINNLYTIRLFSAQPINVKMNGYVRTPRKDCTICFWLSVHIQVVGHCIVLWLCLLSIGFNSGSPPFEWIENGGINVP